MHNLIKLRISRYICNPKFCVIPYVYGGTIDYISLLQLSVGKATPKHMPCSPFYYYFVGLAYQGQDIVFRFIIENNSLMDFDP
jgi:hypothetical protein